MGDDIRDGEDWPRLSTSPTCVLCEDIDVPGDELLRSLWWAPDVAPICPACQPQIHATIKRVLPAARRGGGAVGFVRFNGSLITDGLAVTLAADAPAEEIVKAWTEGVGGTWEIRTRTRRPRAGGQVARDGGRTLLLMLPRALVDTHSRPPL